jgi:UDP-GlcNAc:undecaprenyl-phosphate GlcNAc-1-phosphate transferase
VAGAVHVTTPYLIVFGIAFVLALSLTPLARSIGFRLRMVDKPGGRRAHRGAIPRLGGIAMYVGFTAAVVATMVLPAEWFPARLDPKETTRLTGLLLGTAAVFFFGLLDDRLQFGHRPQYIAQFLASLIAIAFLIHIKHVNNPLTGEFFFGDDGFPWPIVWGLTIFWFMGMMNTVNFLDGLDGLAAGVVAIASAILAVHMWREGQYSIMLLPIALLGATLGFLPWNSHPARVFMGSTGSYVLGYALACLGIIAGAKMATMLLVLALPIIDVGWLILTRLRRGGEPAWNGRDHLHYRLVDIGFTQRQVVLGYYVFCAVFGVTALLVSSRVFKLITVAVLAGLLLTVLWWASRQTPNSISFIHGDTPHPHDVPPDGSER